MVCRFYIFFKSRVSSFHGLRFQFDVVPGFLWFSGHQVFNVFQFLRCLYCFLGFLVQIFRFQCILVPEFLIFIIS